jgi:hypothetical protein
MIAAAWSTRSCSVADKMGLNKVRDAIKQDNFRSVFMMRGILGSLFWNWLTGSARGAHSFPSFCDTQSNAGKEERPRGHRAIKRWDVKICAQY